MIAIEPGLLRNGSRQISGLQSIDLAAIRLYTPLPQPPVLPYTLPLVSLATQPLQTHRIQIVHT